MLLQKLPGLPVSRKHNLSLDFKTQVPQQSTTHGKAMGQEMSISVPRKQGKRYVSNPVIPKIKYP